MPPVQKPGIQLASARGHDYAYDVDVTNLPWALAGYCFRAAADLPPMKDGDDSDSYELAALLAEFAPVLSTPEAEDRALALAADIQALEFPPLGNFDVILLAEFAELLADVFDACATPHEELVERLQKAVDSALTMPIYSFAKLIASGTTTFADVPGDKLKAELARILCCSATVPAAASVNFLVPGRHDTRLALTVDGERYNFDVRPVKDIGADGDTYYITVMDAKHKPSEKAVSVVNVADKMRLPRGQSKQCEDRTQFGVQCTRRTLYVIGGRPVCWQHRKQLEADVVDSED